MIPAVVPVLVLAAPASLACPQSFQVERPVDVLDEEAQQSWSLDLTESGRVLTQYRADDWKRTKSLVSQDGAVVEIVLPQPRDAQIQPPVMYDAHRAVRGQALSEAGVVVGDGTTKTSGTAYTGFYTPIPSAHEYPPLHWSASGSVTGWWTRGVSHTDPMLVVGQAGFFSLDTLFRHRPFAARVSTTEGPLDVDGPVEIPSISHSRARGVGLDVNDDWRVVGWTEDANGIAQAFSWDYPDGPVVPLGTLGGPSSEANAINEHGAIVGQADLPDGSHHACSFEGGDLTDLGTLGGASSSASAINDRGHVVGWSWTAAGAVHAFVVGPDGVMRDLNDMIPAQSGWTLQYAAAINERGQIAGWGRIGGETHGFLLTPDAD